MIKNSLIFIYLLLLINFLSAQIAPQQPASGPGGYLYEHGNITVTKFGSNITDCYWLIEPSNPKPDSAVVIVFWHGTTSVTDIDQVPGGQSLFMEHICKKGYTVIFPLYQYGGQTLPFAQQISNGGNVVKMALNNLDTGTGRIRPKRNISGKILIGATGISRGGGMTMNVATYHDTLGLPSFDALCAFVPGAGQSMLSILPQTKVVIVNGEENTLNFSESQEAFDSLHHISCANKHLIQVNSDYYGTPDLIAEHNFAGSGNNPIDSSKLNALDFYGSWKFAVGVFDCMFRNLNCKYCFGNDTLITYMGKWSDGTPVNPATIMDSCSGTSFINENIYNSCDRIKIYPNPATNFLNIENSDQTDLSIRIYNLQGRLVLKTDRTVCQKIKIPIDDLETGIYLIVVSVIDFNKTYRFIKF